MNNELEQLRADLARSEQQRLAFAERVRIQAQAIAGKCGAGYTQRAGIAALDLCTLAANEKHDLEMQQEQAGNYNLAALHVDVTTASNSETPFEDD